MGTSDMEKTDPQSDKFDKILDKIGLGRWTALMLAVSISWGAFLPYFSLGGAFYNPKVDYSCTVPQLSGTSWTEEQKQNLSIPWEEERDGKLTLSKCYSYARNYSEFVGKDWSPEFSSSLAEEVQVVPCTSWHYDNSTFERTVTTEWDLVCDRSWWSPLFQSVYFFGSAVGEPILGYLADRFGRRWVLRGSSIIFVLFATGSALTPVYSLVLASRFVLGMLHTAGAGVSYVYVMEGCPPKYRTLFGLFLNGPYALTGIAFGGLAYYFRSWRTLQLVCSVPAFLSLILLPFMDESPRWQLLKGKTADGIKTLTKAARWHGVSLSHKDIFHIENASQQISTTDDQSKTKNLSSSKREFTYHVPLQERIFKWIKELFTLVRTPVIRRITLCMFGCWFVVGVIYWGMSLGGNTFSSDPFLYMALSSLMELPGYVAFVPIVSRFGRKKVLSINFSICATAILAILFTPKENTWVIFSLALIGKLFITSSYNILYLFSSELFPTCIRSRGLNISSMMCRIGSIITPFINELLISREGAKWAPSVIFGSLAIFGCIMALFLPESKDKPLSETVEEVERLHGKNSVNSSSQSLDKKATDDACTDPLV